MRRDVRGRPSMACDHGWNRGWKVHMPLSIARLERTCFWIRWDRCSSCAQIMRCQQADIKSVLAGAPLAYASGSTTDERSGTIGGAQAWELGIRLFVE